MCSVKSDSGAAAPWTVAHQAPLSMGFLRQEYWNGLLFPSPGIFAINSGTPALAGGVFKTDHLGSPLQHEEILKTLSESSQFQKAK